MVCDMSFREVQPIQLCLPQVTEKLGNGLDTDTKSIFGLVHEGTEVLEITCNHMGCLTCECCLEDRLVLMCKPGGEGKAGLMFNQADAVLKCVQAIQ